MTPSWRDLSAPHHVDHNPPLSHTTSVRKLITNGGMTHSGGAGPGNMHTLENVSLGSLISDDSLHGHRSSEDDGKWHSTVGALSTGQLLGELCVLNPKMASMCTAIAYTGVEVFCIDAEE